MEFDPTRPIYRQIMEEVRKGTVRGEYAAGAQLPSVRDMALRMGVNPNTMAIPATANGCGCRRFQSTAVTEQDHSPSTLTVWSTARCRSCSDRGFSRNPSNPASAVSSASTKPEIASTGSDGN